VDAVNQRGETPLLRACTHLCEVSVQALLAAGASVNFQRPGLRNTPLTSVVWYGSSTLLTVLLDANADPNLANGSGETALMMACHKFNITQMDMLVKAGAMCDTTDPVGRTALHWLATSPYADSNPQAAVQLLLDNKACVNAQDADGQTALIKLCSANLNFPHRVDFVQVLLDAGADRTIVDKERMTAAQACAANPKVNLGTRLQLMACLEFPEGASSGASKRAKIK
jgi:ankyrin repeat protein